MVGRNILVGVTSVYSWLSKLVKALAKARGINWHFIYEIKENRI